ncbi:MAG: hypothetical protein AB1714_17295 [Acidobacteriota bacterium]
MLDYFTYLDFLLQEVAGLTCRKNLLCVFRNQTLEPVPPAVFGDFAMVGYDLVDVQLTRVYGWDALRLVYPKETRMMDGYDPRGSTEDCRSRTATLRLALVRRADNAFWATSGPSRITGR